ncbi:hypothetical protein CEE44_00665 [Candidatus Woesearchaeota archaeon B3_Woes]|nr:MAG: hypothetical protein CEE44_00665 [Candidatus Woesearchaeota archaeon B3_Woes]
MIILDKLFKKPRTQILIKILNYILDLEKNQVDLSELKKKFHKDFCRVEKIINDYPFLQKKILKNKDYYNVLNNYQLKEELQKLITTRHSARHRDTDLQLKVITVLITLYLFVFSAFNIIIYIKINNKQNEFNQKILEFEELKTTAFLDITHSNLEDEDIERELIRNSTLAEFCIVNKGEIDSGEISILISTNNLIEETTYYDEIPAKSYSCIDKIIQFKINDQGIFSVDVNVSCLNCQDVLSKTYNFVNVKSGSD